MTSTSRAPFILPGLLACALCGNDWSGAGGCCSRCASELRSGVSDLELPGLVALGYYRGWLSRAVRAYKYRQVRALAPTLASPLAGLVSARGWRPAVVTFVPLHSGRRRSRGFDQARLLAVNLAAALDLPCRQMLARVRPTPQQARLDAGQRRRNVRDSFRPLGRFAGDVLLVDDVFTTGATLGTCRETLERAGAQAVMLAVLAVAPRRRREDHEELIGPMQGDAL